jgi:hypothetical protein
MFGLLILVILRGTLIAFGGLDFPSQEHETLQPGGFSVNEQSRAGQGFPGLHQRFATADRRFVTEISNLPGDFRKSIIADEILNLSYKSGDRRLQISD